MNENKDFQQQMLERRNKQIEQAQKDGRWLFTAKRVLRAFVIYMILVVAMTIIMKKPLPSLLEQKSIYQFLVFLALIFLFNFFVAWNAFKKR